MNWFELIQNQMEVVLSCGDTTTSNQGAVGSGNCGDTTTSNQGAVGSGNQLEITPSQVLILELYLPIICYLVFGHEFPLCTIIRPGPYLIEPTTVSTWTLEPGDNIKELTEEQLAKLKAKEISVARKYLLIGLGAGLALAAAIILSK
jgi:hypothetical protein